MTNPDYVLIKFRENPNFRFYDIYTPNKILVEQLDEDNLSNAEAADKLQSAFNNLSGTYIVRIRTKSKSKLNAGGDIKASFCEYTVQMGNGNTQSQTSQNNSAINGIGYLEQVYTTKNEIEALKFQHRMDLFLKDQEIKALNDKLKAKDNDEGLSGTDKLIGLAIAKNLGVDVSMFMPQAPVPISSNVNGITPQNTDSETRVINAVDRLSSINPNFIELLEDLTKSLEIYPDKINTINLFFSKVAAGESLMSAFNVFMS